MHGHGISRPKKPHTDLLEENRRLLREAHEAMEIAKKAQADLQYARAQIRLREFLGVDDNTVAFIQALDPQCLSRIDH
jgi:hypothetical protein